MVNKITKSEDEWRENLSSEQFHVCRQGGTEAPFTGKYNDFKGDGIFVCSCCGNPLFASKTKFNSGTGWPSFFAPLSKEAVALHEDYSMFMVIREEFKMLPWWEWPLEFKEKKTEFIKPWIKKKNKEILKTKLIQWHLDKQWSEIKEFAKTKGITLVGDLPFLCF